MNGSLTVCCLKFRLNYSYMLPNECRCETNRSRSFAHESRIMPFATSSMSIDSQLLTKKKTTEEIDMTGLKIFSYGIKDKLRLKSTMKQRKLNCEEKTVVNQLSFTQQRILIVNRWGQSLTVKGHKNLAIRRRKLTNFDRWSRKKMN